MSDDVTDQNLADAEAVGGWETIGNRSAIRFLNGAIRRGRVSHAYLFVGPERVGKRTLALDLARAINCTFGDGDAGDQTASLPPCGDCSACVRISRANFADVQILTTTTQSSKDADAKAAERRVMIGIDLIKDLQSDALLQPFEGKVKVFIIDEAHRMSADAANALLKTLEEPPEKVRIMLTSPAVELLPETIASRCQIIRMRSVPRAVIADALVARFDVTADEARLLAKLAMGSPGWAIAALSDPSMLDYRRASAARIVEMLAAPLPERFDYASEMVTEFRRNRPQAMDELARWLQVLRDVAMVRHGLPGNVIFDERVAELEVVAQTMTDDDVAAAIKAVQQTRAALQSNAYPPLAFDSMMLGIPGK